jgi:hypothetical protein
MEGPDVRTALLRTITIATALAALAACGESETPAAPASPAASSPATSSPSTPQSESPTEPEPEPEPVGTVVKINISGTTVSPSGKRIEAPLDQPVILQIKSDRAGELHVHSTPEQVVVFKAGTTQDELVFEQPGVVDVEEHETGKVLVQLQVS